MLNISLILALCILGIYLVFGPLVLLGIYLFFDNLAENGPESGFLKNKAAGKSDPAMWTDSDVRAYLSDPEGNWFFDSVPR